MIARGSIAHRAVWVTTLLAVALAATPAPAAEVRVISAGAVRAIVSEMARA